MRERRDNRLFCAEAFALRHISAKVAAKLVAAAVAVIPAVLVAAVVADSQRQGTAAVACSPCLSGSGGDVRGGDGEGCSCDV